MRVKVDGNSVPKLVLEFEQLCLPEKCMSPTYCTERCLYC